MTQQEFYRTVSWRRCRDAYVKERLSIDGGMCEVCGDEPGYIVHHKIWLNDINCNDISISLNHSNLRYECQTCHNREVNPEAKKHKRVGYDAEGNIINVNGER